MEHKIGSDDPVVTLYDPEELELRDSPQQHTLEARAAVRQAQRLQAAAVLLEPALRAAQLADADAASLEAVLRGLESQLAELNAVHGHSGVPRNRPRSQKDWSQAGPRDRYLLFVDESGGPRLQPHPYQGYFALGGLLVSEAAYADLCAGWQEWKSAWIGRDDASMHSRNVSRKNIRFYVQDQAWAEEALERLDELIDGFDARLFVAAIDKAAFAQGYQQGIAEGALPSYYYTLCLDLLLERVVYCLLNRDDAHAQVFAESRNRLEDAKVQLEYQRLQVEGTLFCADTWFRYQLEPHMSFLGKEDNLPGLQLVDVLLRPVVEKLVAPDSEPLRWRTALGKLYDGEGRGVADWGLRIFPHEPDRVEALLANRELVAPVGW